MPGFREELDDGEVAAISNYVMTAFGGSAVAIAPQRVAMLRTAASRRSCCRWGAWAWRLRSRWSACWPACSGVVGAVAARSRDPEPGTGRVSRVTPHSVWQIHSFSFTKRR
jgi:hypothetical protein